MSAGVTSAGRRASARSRLPRAFWHALWTSAAMLAVCAVIGTWSALSYQDADAQLARLTGRAVGTVTASSGTAADITWPTGHASVAMTGNAPPTGTRTEIAYDPHDPADAIIPGAHLLTDADQSRGGVIFAALVALLVLAVDTTWLLRRRRRRPSHPRTVRRIRVQRRLMSRTWLETEPADGTRQRWIPVCWDPVLAQLPAPAEVTVHGDPRLHRIVIVEANGVLLYPSGRVTTREPPGRRIDSPSRPDEHALAKARAAGTLRQLRVDAALAVPAPLLGLVWAYLSESGVPGWCGATALCATLALWLAAIRGSDPT